MIVEVLGSHTEVDRVVLDEIALVEICADGAAAMLAYNRLRRAHPERDLVFVHSSCQDLQFEMRRWDPGVGFPQLGPESEPLEPRDMM
jgi:hypothetical protein